MISLLRKVPSLLAASAIRSRRPNFRQANHCMTTNVESNKQPTLETQTDKLPTNVETQPFYEEEDGFDYEDAIGLFGCYVSAAFASQIASELWLFNLGSEVIEEEMHNHETVSKEELQVLRRQMKLLRERESEQYRKWNLIDLKRAKQRREELLKSEKRMDACIQETSRRVRSDPDA